uniref:Oligosaccharyltransferase complex subunit n=1 Tax=Macrostomum lignano TaxID=282301 RepID=A0A1I8HGF7_9PLAT
MSDIIFNLYKFLECPNLKLRCPSWVKTPSPMFVFTVIMIFYFGITSGVIYDIVLETPSIGSRVDAQGHSRPVAFLPNRINGQYIMEGLAASCMFALGSGGFIMLDQLHSRQIMPRFTRMLLTGVALLSALVAFFVCRIFVKIKIPYESSVVLLLITACAYLAK